MAKRKLKIAQIASPWLCVPPQKYGGTERIIYYLTEELVKMGHEVTLFASGDSRTSARLSAIYPRSLYQQGVAWSEIYYDNAHLFKAFSYAREFDIIHSHIGGNYEVVGMGALTMTPAVYTFHGELPERRERSGKKFFLDQFKKTNFVSISNSQRNNLDLHFVDTVYNGIDIGEFKFSARGGNDLVFLGRITPKKGIIEAIKAAKIAGNRLLIMAKVDKVDEEFYHRRVKPLIDGRQIKFLGEVSNQARSVYLRQAKALLFPIRWREPFGLTMIEAMACGTPVIAFKEGSVPEVVKQGKTGYIVAGIRQMAAAVKKIDKISRERCRAEVEKRFTIQTMAQAYERVYYKVLSKKS